MGLPYTLFIIVRSCLSAANLFQEVLRPPLQSLTLHPAVIEKQSRMGNFFRL